MQVYKFLQIIWRIMIESLRFLPLLGIALASYLLVRGYQETYSLAGDFVRANGTSTSSYFIEFSRWKVLIAVDRVMSNDGIPIADIEPYPVSHRSPRDHNKSDKFVDEIGWPPIYCRKIVRGEYWYKNGRLVPILIGKLPVIGSGMLLGASRYAVSIGYIPFALLMGAIFVLEKFAFHLRKSRAGKID